jgi:hypothetical protein
MCHRNDMLTSSGCCRVVNCPCCCCWQGVSRIIDGVVSSLLVNPDRTFVFADMVSVARSKNNTDNWRACGHPFSRQMEGKAERTAFSKFAPLFHGGGQVHACCAPQLEYMLCSTWMQHACSLPQCLACSRAPVAAHSGEQGEQNL